MLISVYRSIRNIFIILWDWELYPYLTYVQGLQNGHRERHSTRGVCVHIHVVSYRDVCICIHAVPYGGGKGLACQTKSLCAWQFGVNLTAEYVSAQEALNSKVSTSCC